MKIFCSADFHSTPRREGRLRPTRYSYQAFAVILLSFWGFCVGQPAAQAGSGVPSEPSQEKKSLVQVKDGIVLPRRPLNEAIDDAMQFLKKGDGGYVPGSIEGELAGYFTSAHVKDDGSASERQLAFPARQHAYFIFTFLHYYSYSDSREWLLRARDLADWNLAHSTSSDATYPNLPYSAWEKGKPGGSGDKDSTEPDKAAFFGSAYISLYEATEETKYLAAARAIAQTLIRHQREDGSWPFRVVPESGVVREEFGGAPVFFVQFFEDLLGYENDPSYRQARDRAFQLMLERNVKQGLWGTYHEDVRNKPREGLSAEPMAFTANYLFRKAEGRPENLEAGRRIIAQMEERLVHLEGHAAAPAPAVSEQTGFEHMMPGHTARYCLALSNLYRVTGDEQIKRKALSGLNAVTYMQSDSGLFKTFFQKVNENKPGAQRPNWYSQHLYSVCHLLEAQQVLAQVGR